jgi:hypothetical protein
LAIIQQVRQHAGSRSDLFLTLGLKQHTSTLNGCALIQEDLPDELQIGSPRKHSAFGTFSYAAHSGILVRSLRFSILADPIIYAFFFGHRGFIGPLIAIL